MVERMKLIMGDAEETKARKLQEWMQRPMAEQLAEPSTWDD